jgi:plastocyanin
MVAFLVAAGAALFGVLAVVAIVAIACGDSEFEPSSDPGPPVSEITIVGESNQFEPDAFTARAGAEVAVTLDNRDDGVAHNVAFDGIDGASTEVEGGPVVQELVFTAPEPGEYGFVCDVHPGMRGLLYVVDAEQTLGPARRR